MFFFFFFSEFVFRSAYNEGTEAVTCVYVLRLGVGHVYHRPAGAGCRQCYKCSVRWSCGREKQLVSLCGLSFLSSRLPYGAQPVAGARFLQKAK